MAHLTRPQMIQQRAGNRPVPTGLMRSNMGYKVKRSEDSFPPCPAGYRWEDTPSGWKCIPKTKPAPGLDPGLPKRMSKLPKRMAKKKGSASPVPGGNGIPGHSPGLPKRMAKKTGRSKDVDDGHAHCSAVHGSGTEKYFDCVNEYLQQVPGGSGGAGSRPGGYVTNPPSSKGATVRRRIRGRSIPNHLLRR